MNNINIFESHARFMGVGLRVFVYNVDGILIDTGPARMRKDIAAFCDKHKIMKIVQTHYHEDHTGNSAFLSRAHGVPVYAHPNAAEKTKQKGQMPLYRYVFWGHREGFNQLNLPRFIEGNKTVLEAIHTPGHTEDHVAFFDEKQGHLFTGDLFVSTKTKLAMDQENIPQMMNSLRTVLKRDFKTVFCAHGGVINNGYEQIQRKLRNLEELEDKVLELYEKGMEVKEISRRLFPHPHPLNFFSLGEWSARYLVNSFIKYREGMPEGKDKAYNLY